MRVKRVVHIVKKVIMEEEQFFDIPDGMTVEEFKESEYMWDCNCDNNDLEVVEVLEEDSYDVVEDFIEIKE